MKISYLVTCSSETTTLQTLLKKLFDYKNDDQIVIVRDSDCSNKETINIIENIASDKPNVGVLQHPLNADYGTHKNWGTQQCSGDYIFQIDGDELPPDTILGDNLKLIIEANSGTELIFVPRINDYKGVTEIHARQWGWRLSPSPSYENRPIVNWPDYQGRIFKNVPDRIKWDRKLHEKIEGHNQYSFLPAEEEYALYHDKTIEKQLETNLRYNKVFTVEDNMGHKVI